MGHLFFPREVTMAYETRANQIMELLHQKGTVQASQISQLLQVSLVTVRKDLQRMEDEGLLRRTHGGAAIRGNENHQDPRAATIERIAEAAAAQIHAGDCVIMNAGNTTLLTARKLLGRKDLTIITNSIAIARELVQQTGLSVIPGTKAVASVEEAKKAAEKLGYPVMLKACAGGGGRGIRLIRAEEELEEAYFQATGEAQSAFGDGSVYLEKYIFPARHVELQILADEYGNAVCLGDRDCSLQRRNQKLLEETPSPGVSEEQRNRILALAVDAVKQMGYVGVGTLEFLLDKVGNFWFMEMNVRLQVEHCVTEMLVGVDLVKWQIRVAAGIPLNFEQKDISICGAALECRINARNCGTLRMLHVPGGPSVRFDSYLVEGTKVSPYYDSLLGKLIVYAKTREEMLRKMRAALCELVIDGIETNVEEQLRIVEDERFISGDYDLTFMGNR